MTARCRRISQAPIAEPEPEVAVVLEWVVVHDGLEALGRQSRLALVEIGARQRLEDRGFARLQPVGALEDDRRRPGVMLLEETRSATEELVGSLSFGLHTTSLRGARSNVSCTSAAS